MKRTLYTALEAHLSQRPISLLIGARQTGKTTLLKQLQSHLEKMGEQSFFLSLENRQILQLLNENPQNLFQLIPQPTDNTKLYILIDEIQYLDDPSNFLKFHYDTSEDQLKFIVTGSSHFYIDRKFKDSMAGRKRIFELPTLNLEEALRFQGRDDLASHLTGSPIPLLIKDEIMKYFYNYLLYGGYPEVVLAPTINERKEILRELRNSYAKKDVVEAGLKHPDLYLRLMKVTADQIGSQYNINSLATDLSADGKTLKSYLWVMQKSFHIHSMPPFHKRMANELRKMPKIYFADLGLRNSLLNNFSPIGTREDRGELLENYIYLQLKQKAGEEHVKYWRTQNKQEVDFVIHQGDGNSTAYEVKWNPKSFQPSKYAYFQKSYPEIPLECASLDNVLQF